MHFLSCFTCSYFDSYVIVRWINDLCLLNSFDQWFQYFLVMWMIVWCSVAGASFLGSYFWQPTTYALLFGMCTWSNEPVTAYSHDTGLLSVVVFLGFYTVTFCGWYVRNSSGVSRRFVWVVRRLPLSDWQRTVAKTDGLRFPVFVHCFGMQLKVQCATWFRRLAR